MGDYPRKFKMIWKGVTGITERYEEMVVMCVCVYIWGRGSWICTHLCVGRPTMVVEQTDRFMTWGEQLTYTLVPGNLLTGNGPYSRNFCPNERFTLRKQGFPWNLWARGPIVFCFCLSTTLTLCPLAVDSFTDFPKCYRRRNVFRTLSQETQPHPKVLCK